MKVRSKLLIAVGAAVLLTGVTVFAVAFVGENHSSAELPAGDSFQTVPSIGGSSHELGGGDVTVGLQVLTLRPGAAPVAVTGVGLVDPHGLTLVETRLAGPTRPVYQFLSVPGLPPTKYNPVTVAATGSTIEPAKRGWQLLLGLHVLPTTLAKIDGIRVEYRVVGKDQVEQQVFPVTVVVCTERVQLVKGRCPLPDISGQQGADPG